MEKVPNPISTSACRDTPVTVGRLGNVRSGKQSMLTRDQALGYKNEPAKLRISDMFTQMARLLVTKLGGISL